MSRLTTLGAASALLIVLSAGGARGTTMLPADLPQLVAAARAIVHGQVVDVEPRVTSDRREIITLVTIAARDYYKGDLGTNVVFLVPGGEIGRYRSVIVGAPVFRVGDEVVLFLSARVPSLPYVLGLSEGVFRVSSNVLSGEKSVRAPTAATGREPARVVRGDPSRLPIPLSRFAADVRSLVGRQRGVSPRPPREARQILP